MTTTVIRANTDQVFGVRHSRAGSKTTGKPRPSVMTATQTVRMVVAQLARKVIAGCGGGPGSAVKVIRVCPGSAANCIAS